MEAILCAKHCSIAYKSFIPHATWSSNCDSKMSIFDSYSSSSSYELDFLEGGRQIERGDVVSYLMVNFID